MVVAYLNVSLNFPVISKKLKKKHFQSGLLIMITKLRASQMLNKSDNHYDITFLIRCNFSLQHSSLDTMGRTQSKLPTN
jgi:hypothetical protein